MKTKREFVKELFGERFNVVADTAVMNTPDYLFKITFCRGKSLDHYVGLKLQVIGKKEQNVVEQQLFSFDEYLVPEHHDNRVNGFEIISYVNWDWYIQRPTRGSFQLMLDEIDSYINLYLR